MSAKIFISCGQKHDAERKAAAELEKALASEGFEVYVAINAQSIEDVNSGIIGHLRRSDYYIFIDFAREDLGSGSRGSLFTNQELAIAYILGFEHVIFFQQTAVSLEGLLKYMGSNATRFDKPGDVPALVIKAVHDRKWSSKYSRHLVPCRRRWSDALIQYGELGGRFLYIDIENHRLDLAAYDTVARLTTINGQPCPDRSHLKVTGAPDFSQIIWPQNHGAFDFLMVSAAIPTQVFLNSALDVWPRTPIIDGAGKHSLQYAVLARQFPILYFTLELTVTNDAMSAQAEIVAVDSGA